MKSAKYGNPKGKIVIYFHGAPGAPEECAIFDSYAKENDLHIVCYDRFAINPSLKNQAYYQELANLILDEADGKKVDLIGFSIGCHAAIETSLYLQDKVRNIHLVSAAAPLDAENFLDGMAGKMVFLMAMKHSFAFSVLSYWQTLLAKLLPNVLFKMLFSSATGEDKELSKNLDFINYATPLLSHCFGRNLKGYIREVKQYVSPWKESPLKCNVSTHLWHGSSDNWSPIEMAHHLEKMIAAPTNLETMQGLSHYSCLYAAAPKICAQLAKEPI